jgi:hypothetical protein
MFIHDDSKLSEFLFIGHGDPDSNLESPLYIAIPFLYQF